ncbi:hypothetical protein JX266_013501 [Neoarthrinium moseri]|nr:hypothetical protein JX266_013501 [Neoarthrinium moseri]
MLTLFSTGASLALGLGLGASGGGETQPGSSTPLDCQVAQKLDLKPKADCQYTWEHWFDENILWYVVRIEASGQDTAGWFQGIYDNIQGECGYAPGCDPSNPPWCGNNMMWSSRELNDTKLYGLEAAYKIDDWIPGDDQTTCITTAIRKASCGVDLDFVNGKCYKKEGSFSVPYHVD